jgi:hypothetical protein
MTVKTSIAVDCDPECKYKTAVGCLEADRSQAIEEINNESYELTGNLAQTTRQGQVALESVRFDYTGLDTLSAIGSICSRACAIERFWDQHGNFESEVDAVINRLKDN